MSEKTTGPVDLNEKESLYNKKVKFCNYIYRAVSFLCALVIFFLRTDAAAFFSTLAWLLWTMDWLYSIQECKNEFTGHTLLHYKYHIEVNQDTIVGLIKGIRRIRDDLVIVEDKIKEIKKGGKE